MFSISLTMRKQNNIVLRLGWNFLYQLLLQYFAKYLWSTFAILLKHAMLIQSWENIPNLSFSAEATPMQCLRNSEHKEVMRFSIISTSINNQLNALSSIFYDVNIHPLSGERYKNKETKSFFFSFKKNKINTITDP